MSKELLTQEEELENELLKIANQQLQKEETQTDLLAIWLRENGYQSGCESCVN